MKKTHIFSELFQLLIFVSFSVICGFIFENFIVSFLSWLILYILWKWLDYYQFYSWVNTPDKKKEEPILQGLFKQIAQRIIQHQETHEKARKKTAKILKIYQQSAQILPFGLLFLDANLKIIWHNKVALQLLNKTAADLKKSNVIEIINHKKFNKALESEEADRQIFISYPKGSDNKMELRLTRIDANSSMLVLKNMNHENDLYKSRKAFVSNASHELKSPLTVITGYLEMIHADANVSPEWHQAIEQSLIQANHMNKIISDLLNLSQLEHADKNELKSRQLNMPGLLNRLFNDIQKSDQKAHTFAAEIDSSLGLFADHSDITSLVMNLMHNAVVHSGEKTHIQLRWFLGEDGQACLSVADNGKGIPTKHIKHLTERFYRVDNSRVNHSESTGLGLAIVKHIISKYDTQLEINSEVGIGSEFIVRFPASLVRPLDAAVHA